MRRITVLSLALLVLAAFGAGAAFASAGKGDEGSTPEGVVPVVAQARHARLAARVDGAAAVGTFSATRQKGVQAVTNPDAGVFCIQPTAASAINVDRIVPSVATDFSGTAGFSAMAQWVSTAGVCPVGTIRINTLNPDTSTLVNDVAFTIVVN